MRLLHFDAPDKLILTDFRGKSTPPYAILSHRWSNSETLIEDIADGTYVEKEEGYRKLRFCTEQATKDELQYFWIDTCCIDRWDKNERSKAINSMFEWYRNAARCYVFLSDVSVASATEAAQRSSWEASFRRSEWFARGWTLQELIAPASVEFFSREGQRIGDKASLDQSLHDHTGIPLTVLRNSSLDQYSTSERMRWVENRRTTEEEDIVYCLLGVLGVSMPTTYGEGKESAMRRLQAEMEAVGSGAPSIIPFSRNELFVGCESQLAELQAALFSNEHTTTTLAIIGPGGTGKSQLALEAAHRTRLNNKNCSVFWIDANDTDSLFRSYASVAQKLGVSGHDDQTDIKQVVKCCVAEMSARQCLLIFDNAEGTTVPRAGSSNVMREAANWADFLPHSQLCSVIFTTTESKIAETLAPQHVIALDELTPATALIMLQNRLTTPLSNAEQQGAIDLLRKLSHLPLAVSQAAACMNASGMTVPQYQAQLDEHEKAAFEYSDDPSGGRLQEPSPNNVVATTLYLSMGQIWQSHAVAAKYLSLAACVDRNDILLDLLEASSQAREDAIKVLDRYALITRRPAEYALDLHRLVHQALREKLQAHGQLHEWNQRTITQLLQVFPNTDHSNRSKWRRLLPHAQRVLLQSRPNSGNGKEEQKEEEWIRLASKCAVTLISDGRWKEAEELQMQVMRTSKRVLGGEHPDTLTSMANLALMYWNQGRWIEAEELNMQAMQIRKRVLSEEHPDTLTSINNLATIYWNQGRWSEAEVLQMQLIETRKRVLGNEHPDTLTSMANLALTYSDQGRWSKAEKLNMQVMKTRKRVLGADHPSTLTSMHNLALTCWNQGRWSKAEELNVQVMESQMRVLGNEHPDVLVSMHNLALTNSSQGRWSEAEELQMQVTEVWKRVLGDKHPDTLTSMANLASTYSNQGRWSEAEELNVQVVETCKRVLGDDHPQTLNSMANLASTYMYQERWSKAEELNVQVVEIRKRVLGDDHSSTLTSINNLALTCWNQARLARAEELQVQVMKTCTRVLSDDHPIMMTSMTNLALTYSYQGRRDEAEELQMQVMETRKRVLGGEHPLTLTSMSNLAFTLKSLARRGEALALMEKCFQSRQQVLGEQHPDTQSSFDTLNNWRAECSDGDL